MISCLLRCVSLFSVGSCEDLAEMEAQAAFGRGDKEHLLAGQKCNLSQGL